MGTSGLLQYLSGCLVLKQSNLHNPPRLQKLLIQFLRLVSLYQNKLGTSVIAFWLHSFVLYSYNDQAQSTRVHLLIGDNQVIQSSAPERILQILQMIQGEQVNSCSLTIEPDFVVMDNLADVYSKLGFYSKPSSARMRMTYGWRKLSRR
jgi:hypothetical protein